MTINALPEPEGFRSGPARAAGIFALPVVGSALFSASKFYEGMAPLVTDPLGLRVMKEAVRWGSVVTVAGVVGVVVLGASSGS